MDVFVYGTLTRGERNHDRFCRGALRIREATIHGRLYDLPFGFPALVAPDESVLAVGTLDYAADAERQRSTVPEMIPAQGDIVHGELLTFDDPLTRLPALDGLEGFRPGEESLYRRVLIRARAEGETTAVWAYVVERPSGEYLPGGRWPA
ncbi:MAG: gamma-glutamylcyclotransferase family protein [Rubrobacteraceae bacterium]